MITTCSKSRHMLTSSVEVEKVQLLPIKCEAVCRQGNEWGGEDAGLHLGVGSVKLGTLGVFLW